MPLFSVTFRREAQWPDGTPEVVGYATVVEAPSSADAGVWVGDMIRRNDLDQISVTVGTHVPVEPPGSDAGLSEMHVPLLP